ncbi:MAG: LysR family transcriptional regulator [Proteobacteria bacterium]|nr:LysR family transcriptional regulator [Pseudomonadota bacterium]MBS0548956.1 LysR family transcriptional regulator [Pseudomonadota bacterium]
MPAGSLPPLNALRMFLVAARHLSFSRAAVELNVTHGAVSRQVRALEEHLGVALFERQVRQVSLTVEGRQLYAETQPAMEQIAAAARGVTGRAPTRGVRINSRTSFSVRWLIPRLPDFVARHPGIAPQLITSLAAPDKAPEPFDIAIRRDLGGWPSGVKAQPFLEDELLVLAAPSLLKKKPIAEPKALAQHTLLVVKTRNQDWDDWKAHIGLPRLRPAARLQFDHSHIVLQAAVDGLGFAIVARSLLGADVAQGRLVCPLPGLRLPLAPMCYGCAPGIGRETLVFAEWLDRQAALG